MSHRRCSEEDYIEFVLASPNTFSCVEASRTSPNSLSGVAHDAYTRLLTRRPLDTGALWDEAQSVAGRALHQGGLLVLDDTTLDKPYARCIELVTRHWSGKHKQVVSGINLLSLVWTPGYTPEQYQHKLQHRQARQSRTRSSRHQKRSPRNTEHNGSQSPVEMPLVVPLDFAVYDTNARVPTLRASRRLTKNDLLCRLLHQAKERGLCPAYVAFDSWYSGLENLKVVRELGWRFLTRVLPNRAVTPDNGLRVEVRTLSVSEQGQQVWLKGFGPVRLFQKTRSDGKGGHTVEHWITNDVAMTQEIWHRLALSCWVIESYHRGLKSCCGVERSQVRSAHGQKNHLFLCLRAFVRLEHKRLQSGLSWYQAKRQLVRTAIANARQAQHFLLPSTA